VNDRGRRFQPINLLFGLMMGTADIVPGVSGGTVALIVGIYERLIGSVRAGASAAARLIRGRVGEARMYLAQIDWGLVIPLGIGIVTALVIGARVLVPVLGTYPIQSHAIFFGLITGSLAVPWHRMRERRPSHWLIAAAAAVTAFVLVGVPPRELLDPALAIVFLAAAIAICAMILPGVSGSFLLLVMGLYQPTLRALREVDVAYIAVFMAGAAIGLGSFSKLLHYLLRFHHDATMAALVGLMAGSLRALWPYQDESRRLLAPSSIDSLLTAAALAAVGFALVFVLARFGSAAEARRAEEPVPASERERR
jgi:putative membrane protein